MEAIDFYKKVETPPDWALKSIGAGRLKGMTDINPQWRISVLNENFGMCGFGWKYNIVKLWFEDCNTERVVFAEIALYLYDKENKIWSEPIPGIGGSKMMTKESSGIYVSDECYKMAITDAISVACKQLGIGASIYSGSKYIPILEMEADKKKKDEESQRQTEMLDNFLREIDTVSNRDELTKVYNKYKHLKGNASFDNKLKAVGELYPKTT